MEIDTADPFFNSPPSSQPLIGPDSPSARLLETPFDKTAFPDAEAERREAEDSWNAVLTPPSTQGSPKRPKSLKKMHGISQSLPNLRGTWFKDSPHKASWHDRTSPSNSRMSTASRSLWSPLGSTWRDRENDEHGSPLKRNADDLSAFVDGCVPNWSRCHHVRKAHMLEHHLTWAWYRMKRHDQHPGRTSVGDPYLPLDCVVEPMRSGSGNRFSFWRDLKPPFSVNAVKRCPKELEDMTKHPDGDLYFVSYNCAIDYVSERLWGENTDAGTFDKKISGIAKIRIPEGFPTRNRDLVLVEDWGRPRLNGVLSDMVDGDGSPMTEKYVDPDKWMPISEFLELRPGMPRFAACREATHQAHRREDKRKEGDVLPMQKMLLGVHATLPKLAASANASCESTNVASGASPKKKRQHRIFTSAAGFVSYTG